LRASSGFGTSLVISGSIDAAEIPLLCERLGRLLLDTNAVTCDVSRLAATVAAVDALARLQLTARRLGGQITLVGASARLDELVGICGLTDILAARPG
jgi:ABC-type transporter Mla MlaB component